MAEPPRKRKRAPSWKLEIPGDDIAKEILCAKLRQVRDNLRQKMNKAVNYYEILDKIADFWLDNVVATETKGQPNKTFTPYHESRSDKNEVLFVGTTSAMAKICEITKSHKMVCSLALQQKKVTMRGHVAIVTLTCEQKHSYIWTSSPHLPNKKFLVNYKMAHGMETSGILPITYQRLCMAAGCGHLSFAQKKVYLQSYNQCIDEEYEESVDDALIYETNSVENLEEGISVMSDARHGWRKNAKDTSVVVIGDNSHKVLCHEHVTKADDPITQRHEKLGTKNVLDKFEEKNIGVNLWIHDRNTSVNSLLREKQIKNQNDLWHAVKNTKKTVQKVTTGAKKRHGQTWHFELADKMEGISNHIHYAARRSKGDDNALKQSMDTIVPHYKGQHGKCHPESRCVTDKNYEASKIVITDKKAEILLTNALHSTIIYKHPEDFALGKDTHYVESFNNVLNIFQDKRINFSSKEYQKRAKLAVLHWNENVDRGYTSEWHKPTAANKRSKTKKIYKNITYQYRKKLWQRFFKSVINQ